MKNILFLLIFLSFSLSAISDDLLIRADKTDEMNNLIAKQPQKGFDFCQKNQNIIYKKALSNYDFKIQYLLNTINEEANLNPNSFRLIYYKEMLFKIITEYIWIKKIQNQMLTKSLYSRYLSSNRLNAPSFLELENEKTDLVDEISKLINKYDSTSEFFLNSISNIKDNLIEESTKKIPLEYLVYIFKGEASQTIKALIKSASISEGGKLFTTSVGLQFSKEVLLDVGKGALLDLLVKPLQGYTYSMDTQWTNALDNTPLLIIDPDLFALNQHDKKLAGLASSEAWRFHCTAMIRKTSTIEAIFNLDEMKSKRHFLDRIKHIISMPDYADPNGAYQQPAIIDNTFVAKKYIK